MPSHTLDIVLQPALRVFAYRYIASNCNLVILFRPVESFFLLEKVACIYLAFLHWPLGRYFCRCLCTLEEVFLMRSSADAFE